MRIPHPLLLSLLQLPDYCSPSPPRAIISPIADYHVFPNCADPRNEIIAHKRKLLESHREGETVAA